MPLLHRRWRRRLDHPGKREQKKRPCLPPPRFPPTINTHTLSLSTMRVLLSTPTFTHSLPYPHTKSSQRPKARIRTCFPPPPPRRPSLSSSPFAFAVAEGTPATAPPCDSTSRRLSRMERSMWWARRIGMCRLKASNGFCVCV